MGFFAFNLGYKVCSMINQILSPMWNLFTNYHEHPTSNLQDQVSPPININKLLTPKNKIRFV